MYAYRPQYLQMANSVPNFNFLDRLVSEIWGGPKIKNGNSWFPQTPPSGQILYTALVWVNAYKCAKFQLPNFISYWDMEGVLRRPLADKFLYVAIVPPNPTSVPNFNFLARLVSETWGGPNIKSGRSWFPQTPPSGQIFIRGASTRKCLQVCQISTS